jgi:hypothetical protein
MKRGIILNDQIIVTQTEKTNGMYGVFYTDDIAGDPIASFFDDIMAINYAIKHQDNLVKNKGSKCKKKKSL